MLNPFFQNGTSGEQGLIQSLVNEQIKMYGIEVYYMPRKYISKFTVIKEVIQSEFDNAYPIEAYVDNYEGYGGQGTILSKFGIQEQDDLTLIISRERFENYVTPLIKNLPNIELATRPKEGDLIYFPLGDRLFEIKYVEHEQPFYQLQKNYVYQIRCELFRYEDEVLDTGVETIDDEIEQIGYIQTLTLVGSGVTATGTASTCASGSVQQISILNMGGGYTSPPKVAFSSAPSDGVTAVGFASLSYDYVGCDGKTGKVVSINLTNTGCGYTVAPMITIRGGDGHGAIATAGITTLTSVQTITITNAGSGYTFGPSITISDPPSGQASAGIGTINTAGIVTDAYITNSGFGYTEVPTVTFQSPGISTDLGGTFIFNEVVTGSASSTTARVKEWNAVTNKLEISIVSGELQVGENIVGEESGAKYMIFDTNTDDLVTPYADNDNIEIEADSIIDFSERNPFGMP